MKDNRFQKPLGPDAPIGEILLAGAAVRIEPPPPGKHHVAAERFEAVRNHVELRNSPLHDRLRILLPARLGSDPAHDVSRSEAIDVEK